MCVHSILCVCVCECVCAFHSAVHTCFIFLVSVVRVCASLNIAGVEESLCCRLKSTGGREGGRERGTEGGREGVREGGREGRRQMGECFCVFLIKANKIF